jgi:hypothetical protein
LGLLRGDKRKKLKRGGIKRVGGEDKVVEEKKERNINK